jgi:hypothetical protein
MGANPLADAIVDEFGAPVLLTGGNRAAAAMPSAGRRARPAAASRRIYGLLGVAAALIIGVALPVSAAFEDGLRAYDAGDYATAAREWRKLAAACNPQAATALAGLYRDGLGVPQDERLASHWYSLAAEAGEPVAQAALGERYAEGRGVVQDSVKAYFWLGLAARQGMTWAVERIKKLDPTMTREGRDQAQTLIASFRPATRERCK